MFSVGHWNCLPPPPNSFACCIRCETRKIQFKDMPCTKGIYVAIELAVYGSFLLKSRNKKRNLNTAPNTGEWTPLHLKQRNWRKKKKKKGAFFCKFGKFKTTTFEINKFLLIQYRCPLLKVFICALWDIMNYTDSLLAAQRKGNRATQSSLEAECDTEQVPTPV